MSVLPPSRRPGRHGPWRVLAEEALRDGNVRDGIADNAYEARLIVRRIRRAADELGGRVRSSFRPEAGGKEHWYIVVLPKGEQ